ncbi:osmoprotectant transporter permease [bacterium]|nr:osmoprotectant transporter permease [bacterium]
MRQVYAILWTLDALTGLVCLFYFLSGVKNGTVSADNIGIWIAMIAVMAAVLGGGRLLMNKGHRTLAVILLLIPALPALLYLLFLVLLLFSRTPWN